ncbi:MAG: hypothetical protein HY815_18055 [Candidatus Riflebacteria bacterium]|nr:hypothetical protein [Candidatus Riflebacteria bacterium]
MNEPSVRRAGAVRVFQVSGTVDPIGEHPAAARAARLRELGEIGPPATGPGNRRGRPCE